MRKLISLNGFKVLTFAAALLSYSTAHANSNLNSPEIMDISSASDPDLDFLVTKGFLHDLEVVSFQTPSFTISPESAEVDLTKKARKSGWAGLVEVELNGDKKLRLDDVTTFSDNFAVTDQNTKLSGFYTMRYEFATKLPFRPYAGAGLGVVTTTNETDTSGIIAGRATAGFDLTLGEGSAIFAEYAFVKNGGVNLGSGNSNLIAIPDSEHSLKLGFRRTF